MKKILYEDINIKRTGKHIDEFFSQNKTLPSGHPLFFHIEFSINGTCNRRCFFCPRVDPEKYPNIATSLDIKVFEKMVLELKKVNFNGRISFSGFGEPLLTKNLYQYVEIVKKNLNDVYIEVTTNGDVLLSKNGPDRLKKLFSSGLTNIKVSLYDGPEQIEPTENVKKKLNLSDEQFIIRKRYLGPEESYGLTISNRAGSVELKNEAFEIKALSEPLKQPCYFPFYKMMIDYNGDVLICSNDWKKEAPVGNIKTESILDIWVSEKFVNIRKKLSQANRNYKPCKTCDVNGTLNAKKAFDDWQEHLSK
tara:strand:- start:310 stop:1230 length:921 start_codon:yes stop_codon:yes gene_type:complete